MQTSCQKLRKEIILRILDMILVQSYAYLGQLQVYYSSTVVSAWKLEDIEMPVSEGSRR